MEKILHRILFNAATRKDLLERLQRQTTAMLVIGGIAVLAMIFGFSTGAWSALIITVIIIAAIGAYFWLGREKPNEFDPGPIAQTIEREHPELQAMLITAVEQEPDPTGNMNYLQHRVIEVTLEEARRQQWVNFVDEAEIQSAKFKRMVWTLLTWTAVVVLGFFGFRNIFNGAPSIIPPLNINLPAFGEQSFEVTPGDTTIEKGSRLPVSIKFNADVPTKVDLLIGSDEDNLRTIPMVKNLEDPVFGAIIPEINETSVYKLHFGDGETPFYKISVFEFPRLESANATITPPEYTGLEVKTLKDVTFVNAVEQSKVRFDMVLNKPVKEAKLVADSDEKQEIILKADDQSAEINFVELTATKTIDFDLYLVDTDGRENKKKDRITINVLKNTEPLVKIKFPGRDVDISPIEELRIEAEASDDFGLERYGIAYDFKGESKEIIIAEPKGKELEGKLNHVFSMEKLEAEVDELFSYFVWAEDIGPDGKVRRVSSDMFFAEIRPFEKIFREATGQGGEGGEQPPGGQGAQLAKLQKDIINATWKLIRTGDKPEGELVLDLEAVTEAQKQVAVMIEEAVAQAQGEAAEFLKQAIEHIEKAVPGLEKAVEDKSTEPLRDALKEEQAAYQALLKLRAREIEVMRGEQQGQGQGQASDADQAQIDNMNLREEERRYETESEAEKQRLEQQRQQQQENSETQKYLERLKDLARRQEGLDDQIKDLQVALDMAKTEEEKEEIMRQLKRLREEQRDLLRDLDQMREDLNAPERRELADTRDELDKIRENVQDSAEALSQSDADGAAAASTRARESLEELKEDVRDRTGSQFKEQMRDLREQARDLVEQQEQISKEIQDAVENENTGEESAPRERISLDGNGGDGSTGSKIAEQKEKLEKVTDEMKRLTQESEIPEPLLSKKLYDAIREVKPEKVGDRMDATAQDLNRGNPESAQQRNLATNEDIQKLSSAIEDAARSVLGNERDALELAKNELNDLVNEVESTLPGTENSQQPGGQQPGGQQPGGQQPGGQQPGGQQPGGQQPGGQQPGGQQPGGQQPGGQQPGGQQPGGQQPGGQQPGGQQPGGLQPGGLQPSVQPPQPGGQQPGVQPPQPGGQPPQPGGQQPDQNLQPGVQPPQPGEQQPGEQQPGEQQPGGQQPGGQQPGGQQPGGQQPGGQQPGGQQPGGQQPGEQQPGGQQPGGQQPGGQQPGGQQPGGQQPGGQQPGGQQPGGQQPGGQQPGDQQPGGQQPGGQQPGGQQPGGQQPGGQQPGGQQPGGQQPGGQQPGGQQPGGQQPGGQQPGGQQPGGQQPGGQQPGGQQPGGQQPGGQQPGGQQPGGQQPGGQQPGGQQPGGQQPGGQQPGGQQPGGQQPGGQQPGGNPNGRAPGGRGIADGFNQPSGPTQTPDENMRDWVEQLSDIQDVLDDPEMRDSAGRVKDDVKDLIREMKRGSKPPTEDTIKNYVLNPLGQLSERVEEELSRLGDDQEKLVPIDRDPVPEAYSDLVRKYYEELGKGK